MSSVERAALRVWLNFLLEREFPLLGFVDRLWPYLGPSKTLWNGVFGLKNRSQK